MRSKIPNQVRVALIALAALAPLYDDTANAGFFRGGGGMGGFNGRSWSNGPSGSTGGSTIPSPIGRGGPSGYASGRGWAGGETGDYGSEKTRGPHPTWTPTGGHGSWRRYGGQTIDPPPYFDYPDYPVQHPHRSLHYAGPPVPPGTPPTLAAPAPPRRPQPATPVLAARAVLPRAGETRYRAGEVLVEIPYSAPPALVADMRRRHRLAEVDSVSVGLLGLSLRLWKTADARATTAIIRELGSESALVRIQPNYIYASSGAAVAAATPPVGAMRATLSAQQYALVKMKVAPSLESPASAPVRVAVIDTGIDETHPALKGVVVEHCDAIDDGAPVRSTRHGTAMAGGIAAHGDMPGVAPHVKILSARAFDADDESEAEPQGTTESIVKALQWSSDEKAQVINMSFAGPDDPYLLHDALAAANARGIALVGAAGNSGPAAPAQYPGADANVIAATATDENDKLFAKANVGDYVAIAAPGVDVVLPASGGGYAMETGTSVSSALVAGVVALMLERNPDLKPLDIRRRLTATATPLGRPGHAKPFGAGLVDASRAVER